MRYFTILMALLGILTTVSGQSHNCGHSLWNLLAQRANVEASTWTISEFRTEATRIAASVGLVYDQSASGNLAIIAAICSQPTSHSTTNIETTVDTSLVFNFFDTKKGLSTDTVLYISEKPLGHVVSVDTHLVRRPFNIETHSNPGALQFSIETDGTPRRVRATVVNWLHIETPAEPNWLQVDSSRASTETSIKNVYLTLETGHKKAMSLWELYLECWDRGVIGQRQFEWHWRRFLDRHGDKHPGNWGQSASWTTRYQRPWWAWYWLTYNKLSREAWLEEVGPHIMVLPIYSTQGQAAPMPTGNGLSKGPKPTSIKAHRACKNKES